MYERMEQMYNKKLKTPEVAATEIINGVKISLRLPTFTPAYLGKALPNDCQW